MAAALAKVSVKTDAPVAVKPAVKTAAAKPVTTAVKSAVPAKKVAVAAKPTTTVRPVSAPVAQPVSLETLAEETAEIEPELDPGSAIQNIVTDTPTKPVAETVATAPAPTQEAEADDSGATELPSNVTWEEVDTNPQRVGFNIRIFGTGCLECSCLVEDPELPKIPENKLPSCHFSKGQDLCPARAVRIQPVGEFVLFVRKWNKAKDAGDSNRILRYTKELGEMETDQRDKIMREIGLLNG